MHLPERLVDWLILAALLVVSAVFLLARNDSMIRGLRARSLEMSGTLEGAFSSVGRYAGALEENEYLRRENMTLSSQVAATREAIIENSRLRHMLALADSLPIRRVAARIVYKDVAQERNTITLNVGSNHGVEEGMAVVDPRGIIGKVVLVARRHCQVMTYLNADLAVPAKIQPHQSDGIVRWRGENRDLLDVDHVFKTEPVARGQLVVTSGYSSVFRPGLPIGIVDSVQVQRGRPSWRILVRPLARLDDAEHVFVILDRPDPDRISVTP